MNKCIIIGRTTDIVELQYSKGGIPFVKFTLAVPRNFNKKEVDFIHVAAWRKMAENCARYLTRGSMCCVEGELHIGQHCDGTGGTHYFTEIVAENVEFIRDHQPPIKRQAYSGPLTRNSSVDDLPF